MLSLGEVAGWVGARIYGVPRYPQGVPPLQTIPFSTLILHLPSVVFTAPP